jgi:hypothetical protein
LGQAATRTGIALAPKFFAVATKAKTTVKLDLPQKLRDKPKKDGKLDLVLAALVLDPARHSRQTQEDGYGWFRTSDLSRMKRSTPAAWLAAADARPRRVTRSDSSGHSA